MYDASVRRGLAACLADAFLAGDWESSAILARAAEALDPTPVWTAQVIADVLAAYHHPPRDSRRELSIFISDRLAEIDPRAILDAITPPEEQTRSGNAAALEPPRIRRWRTAAPAMGRARWPVPEISSPGELAEWLELAPGELAWMADVRGLERSVNDERLRHYRYGTLERPGRPARVIERPKRRLKLIQRRILHEILAWIPTHEASHGFVRGRSVITHATLHSGQFTVIRIDLEDFFGSIAAGRVYGIFRAAGYPEAVAHALAGLTTNVVPAGVWTALPSPVDGRMIGAHHRLGRRLATPHLPQGAPSSPALANLSCFRLDRRLSGLARSFDARYTRYADDLTFSGPVSLLRGAATVRAAVAAIAGDEGFRVNQVKSTLATRAGRQRVGGLVVNVRPNVAREEYDLLRAIIHNAAIRGPESQNRGALDDFRSHLLGRISWVASANPARGEKLREQFAAIRWQD